MKRLLLIIACCAPLCALAQSQSPAQGFDAYRLVRLRNIFDPSRTGVAEATGKTPAPPPPSAAPPPKASDFIALTGVMVTADKSLAFFSGSRPDYDKVIPANTEIAGAKITKITPTGIEVERAGRKIVVSVGQTVPFDNSAPGPAPESVAGAAASTSGGAADAGGSQPSSSSNGNLDEIMRRMMERRQQQLK